MLSVRLFVVGHPPRLQAQPVQRQDSENSLVDLHALHADVKP